MALVKTSKSADGAGGGQFYTRFVSDDQQHQSRRSELVCLCVRACVGGAGFINANMLVMVKLAAAT